MPFPQRSVAPTLRATIALCFFIGELFSLAFLAMKGRLGLDQLDGALLLLPPLALGLLCSGWVHTKLSAARLRDALLLFAVVSGIVLIVQSAAA